MKEYRAYTSYGQPWWRQKNILKISLRIRHIQTLNTNLIYKTYTFADMFFFYSRYYSMKKIDIVGIV